MLQKIIKVESFKTAHIEGHEDQKYTILTAEDETIQFCWMWCSDYVSLEDSIEENGFVLFDRDKYLSRG